MRLTQLTVRRFKAFSEATIPLSPFTVLVGPNGAGKSTVLQAIDLLGGLVRGTISELLTAHEWEYADLPHLRSSTSKMDLQAALVDGEHTYAWDVTLGARRHPGVELETVSRDGDLLLTRVGRRMKRRDESTGDEPVITQTLASSWLAAVEADDAATFPGLLAVATWGRAVHGYFFLDPLKLRAPARSDGQDIGPHGEALAPFLAHLREHDPAAFQRVVARVRRQYPRLEEVRPRRKEYGWASLELRERWNGDVATFNARQVSDGLLRLLAVSAMHELPHTPSVLLLDEIENGLHPHLLGGFVRMLQDLTAEGRTQVIVTTHSPITLNDVDDPANVLLVSRQDGGGVRVTPLPKTHGFSRLRKHFDFGELWYNVGEDKLVR